MERSQPSRSSRVDQSDERWPRRPLPQVCSFIPLAAPSDGEPRRLPGRLVALRQQRRSSSSGRGRDVRCTKVTEIVADIRIQRSKRSLGFGRFNTRVQQLAGRVHSSGILTWHAAGFETLCRRVPLDHWRPQYSPPSVKGIRRATPVRRAMARLHRLPASLLRSRSEPQRRSPKVGTWPAGEDLRIKCPCNTSSDTTPANEFNTPTAGSQYVSANVSSRTVRTSQTALREREAHAAPKVGVAISTRLSLPVWLEQIEPTAQMQPGSHCHGGVGVRRSPLRTWLASSCWRT